MPNDGVKVVARCCSELLTDSACKSTLRLVHDDDEANSASEALSVSSAMSYASLEPVARSGAHDLCSRVLAT